MKLEEYLHKREELQTQLKDGAKSMVTDFFNTLFSTFPIEKAKWRQYTPYFNDGESCVFGVGEPDLLPVDADEEAAESYEEGYMYCGAWEDPLNYKGEPNPRYKPAFEGIRKWLKTFNQLEDALELCFGDHVQVEVSRNESGELDFSVEECEHD